jgi:hypothetical protein
MIAGWQACKAWPPLIRRALRSGVALRDAVSLVSTLVQPRGENRALPESGEVQYNKSLRSACLDIHAGYPEYHPVQRVSENVFSWSVVS